MKLWPQAQSIRLKLGCRPGYLGHSAAPVYGSAIRMIDNVTLEPVVPPEGTPVEGVIPARLNVALVVGHKSGEVGGSYEVKVVLHVPNKDPHTFPTSMAAEVCRTTCAVVSSSWPAASASSATTSLALGQRAGRRTYHGLDERRP